MLADTLLQEIYATLRRTFGHQHWWPADSPFEVVVGALLTQNTNWANVTRAIENLDRAGLLEPAALARVDEGALQALIRPAGYFRQKAARLKRLAGWISRNCNPPCADLAALMARPLGDLREELISLRGVGPETADSILLYALRKPVFVVDAYTVRVLGRHELVEPGASYDEVQDCFHAALPLDVELFQDFHAQLVEVGKRYCARRAPKCRHCPLHPLLGDPAEAEECP